MPSFYFAFNTSILTKVGSFGGGGGNFGGPVALPGGGGGGEAPGFLSFVMPGGAGTKA